MDDHQFPIKIQSLSCLKLITGCSYFNNVDDISPQWHQATHSHGQTKNLIIETVFESLMSYLSTLWLSAIGMWDESERAAASQNNPSKPAQWTTGGFQNSDYPVFTAQASLSW